MPITKSTKAQIYAKLQGNSISMTEFCLLVELGCEIEQLVMDRAAGKSFAANYGRIIELIKEMNATIEEAEAKDASK